MNFTQVTFLFAYMPISIILYIAAYFFSKKNIIVCNVVLVLEGLVFLWWAEPKLLLFVIIMSLLLFLFGRFIGKAETSDEKRNTVTISVLLLLFFLILSRYLPSMDLNNADGLQTSIQFFSGEFSNVCVLFAVLGGISYMIDVYKEKAKADNILNVLAYTLLFPKAICGPAVLWKDFEPQLERRELNIDLISIGIERFIIGLAKKVIIADTFYAQILLIDAKMNTVGIDVPTMWLRTILVGFWLYLDISGYSDMAIGLCQVFGFDIGDNFRLPYTSNSLSDFWRRFNISLMRWFKEYVYIPLGGSLNGIVYVNILVTSMLIALCHGWRSTLLIWGMLSGLLIVLERNISQKSWYQKIPSPVKTIIILLIISLGWILFMSEDLQTAGMYFRNLFISSAAYDPPNFTWQFFLTRRIIIFLLISALGSFGCFSKLGELIRSKANENVYLLITKCLYLIILVLSLIFVMGGPAVPYVYQAF